MNNDDLPAKKPANSVAPPSGKVFDVVRPGKVLASPTSRPVIVGQKPITQDDQFVTPPDRQLMEHKQMDNLSAPSTPQAVTLPAAPEPTVPVEPAANERIDLPSSTFEEKPTPQGIAVAQTVSVPDQEIQPSVTHDPVMEQAIAEADEKLLSDSSAPLIDQAIISQHVSPKRTVKIVLLVLVIILLLVVIVDLLLDANLLKLNGIPHTRFIG